MTKGKVPEERIRLFRNDFLERTTMVSPIAFVVTWSVMLALAVYASWGVASFVASVGLVMIGLLIWSLFEYGMHRFLFHMKLTSDLGRAFVFLTHGNHHAQPNDAMRNIMPPVVSIGISSMVWAILCLVAGDAGSVIFIGFGIGYVTYDSIHYACHQFPMRHGVLGRLRRHHIRHHYAQEEGNFAITAIFWDRLFGTEVSTKRR
ncbi:sterol desaturase family protein [Sphingomonas sp. RB3P16]|uniref:sterol desaturase family protein n=1 Tax=Parasphingomonas frigoris TaxID=3096163 RepID=UPI002FC76DA7